MNCYFCGQPGADTQVDYCTATGKKTLPGLNSRNFDDRYGFPCHSSCLAYVEKHQVPRRKVIMDAAPDLLEACRLALRILERDGIRPLMGEAFTQTDVERIKAAVARAEGGADQ